MDQNIEPEFKRIRRLIDEESKRALQEANDRGAFHSGAPVSRVVKSIPNILEKELMKVTEHFYEDKHLETIKQFVNQQKESLEKFIANHWDRCNVSPDRRKDDLGLGERFDELKGRLENRQKQVNK